MAHCIHASKVTYTCISLLYHSFAMSHIVLYSQSRRSRSVWFGSYSLGASMDGIPPSLFTREYALCTRIVTRASTKLVDSVIWSLFI